MASLLLLFPFLLLPTPSFTFCNTTCGSLPIHYPFGTDHGCGSPRFRPSVTCSSIDNDGGERLVLTTHAGVYPITSISYQSSTITISPPLMSTCSSMYHSTPNLGLDWSDPFQIGPSLFLLLACPPPTTSLTYNGSSPPVCDATKSSLCTLIHTCPTIVSLGLPLFAPTTTCCVYSPASLGPKDELDIQGFRCAAYTSVASFGDVPVDPRTWEYGVVLKWLDEEEEGGVSAEARAACERSGGVCGYAPPRNYFVCVCMNGVNTSTDCTGQIRTAQDYWTSSSAKAALLISSSFTSCFCTILFLNLGLFKILIP